MEGEDLQAIPWQSALLACEPPASPRAALAACYPDPTLCPGRPLKLEALGVRLVCNVGRTTLPGGFRVLGKGHAATVVAVVTDGGPAALKALRPDSKRESLAAECAALERAAASGASPRPLACSEDAMLVELVWGATLEEALAARDPLLVALEAVEAARALDTAGILHLEIHRPWRSILYPHDSIKAYIVDLESSSEGCGNASRVAQALARRLGRITSRLLVAMRDYKRGCGPSEYRELKKALEDAVTGPIEG